MGEDSERQLVLSVRFYRSNSGNEPVRDWLRGLTKHDRRIVGEDIKTAQFGWPIGMPLIRKVEPGLWEVRSEITDATARVMFSIEGSTMILLHAFVKKAQSLPRSDLKTARRRLVKLKGSG